MKCKSFLLEQKCKTNKGVIEKCAKCQNEQIVRARNSFIKIYDLESCVRSTVVFDFIPHIFVSIYSRSITIRKRKLPAIIRFSKCDVHNRIEVNKLSCIKYRLVGHEFGADSMPILLGR